LSGFHEALQPVELVVPKAAALLQPEFGVSQRPRHDSAGDHAAGLFAFDQSRRLQGVEVLHDAREGDFQRQRDLRYRQLLLAQTLENAAARSVSQCAEHAVQRGSIVTHLVKY
jgi:hypothetical protein